MYFTCDASAARAPAGAGAGLGEKTAPLQRVVPEGGEVAFLPLGRQRLPAGLEMRLVGGSGELRQRAAQLLGRAEKRVAGRQRVEYRLHHRLHQAIHPGPGPQVVPSLQCVVLRQQEIAQGGGLIQVHRGRDLVAHLAQPVGKSARPGEGVCRIGVVHQEHRHLTGIHRSQQGSQCAVSVRDIEVRAEVDRFADVTRDEVQDVYCGADLGGSGMLAPDAARHREARASRGKFTGHPLDGGGRKAGLLGRHLWSEVTESSQQPRAPTPGGQQHIGHRQRQRGLGAGANGVPLVGVETGEIHSGGDVHKLGDVASGEPVRLGEPALVLHGPGPGLQEIGSEREDVLRLGEVVGGKLVHPEHLPVGRPERLRGERLVADQTPPEGAHPFSQQIGESPPPGTGDHRHSTAGWAQFGGEPGDGVVPGDLLPAAARAPGHGPLQAARIVEALERRLSAGAELALVDRMLRVALELDRAAFAGAHMHAASGRALGTAARVPGCHAGDLILRLDQVGNQLLDPARGAAGEGQRPAA